MAAQRITTEQVRSLMASPQRLKLLDVLPRESYRLRHIPGAISLPLDEIDQRALQLLDKSDTIVVYCASAACPDSAAAEEKLLALGFDRVLDYRDGLEGYRAAGGELQSGFDNTDYSNCGC